MRFETYKDTKSFAVWIDTFDRPFCLLKIEDFTERSTAMNKLVYKMLNHLQKLAKKNMVRDWEDERLQINNCIFEPTHETWCIIQAMIHQQPFESLAHPFSTELSAPTGQ